MENKIKKQNILGFTESLAKYFSEPIHESISNDIISIDKIVQQFRESLEKIYPEKVANKQEEIFNGSNTKVAKNLYLLNTINLSRLQYDKDGKLYLSKEHRVFSDCINKNIYITSDDEIRDCWVLSTYNNEVYFLEGDYGIQPIVKKVILTTDQYLIKNGVQAIDDEFLEWFVKNHSCEYVDIESTKYFENHPELQWNPITEWLCYGIIIPQSEHKQDSSYNQTLYDYLYDELGVVALDTNMQEIERIVLAKADIKGQLDKMYSEEEVISLLSKLKFTKYNSLSVKKWFEKFKNK